MIVSDKHRFVFIHIPKCAGGSVRSILHELDSTEGRFAESYEMHPVIGKVDMTHIPLSILREHYPEVYKKIEKYFAVAVVRDPFERFPSSLSQHLSMFGKRPLKSMTSKELRQAMSDAIRYLDGNRAEACLSYDYIHFQRQVSYVFDQGIQRVDKIYDISDVPKMLEDIGALVGNPIVDPRKRQVHLRKAMVYKPGFLGSCMRLFDPYIPKFVRRSVSEAIKEPARDLVLVHRNEKFRSLFRSNTVRDFISDYYIEDIALHKTVDSTQKASGL